MPVVINTLTGTQRHVKNLGWLLRHAYQAEHITITRIDSDRWDCELQVVLGDLLYVCTFADFTICERWVKRPSLRHADVLVLDSRSIGRCK